MAPHLACWLATGLPLALEPSSAGGGSTIFSATSVSTEKVGSTMKSMKPGGGARRRRGPHVCVSPKMGTGMGMEGGGSPICDWATSVEVRSQRGEKGSPSSASLSPWRG